MPTRIRIPQRIVERVRIAIKALRIPRRGHNRVRLEEAAQHGIVLAGVVIVEAQGGLVALAGVLPIRGHRTIARAAVGKVALRAQLRADGGRRQARTAEVVAVQVGEGAVLAHRDALAVEDVVFGDGGRSRIHQRRHGGAPCAEGRRRMLKGYRVYHNISGMECKARCGEQRREFLACGEGKLASKI